MVPLRGALRPPPPRPRHPPNLSSPPHRQPAPDEAGGEPGGGEEEAAPPPEVRPGDEGRRGVEAPAEGRSGQGRSDQGVFRSQQLFQRGGGENEAAGGQVAVSFV